MKIHPEAVDLARWKRTADYRRLCDGTAEGHYLRNRVEAAFMAGWNAAEQRAKDAFTVAVERDADQ